MRNLNFKNVFNLGKIEVFIYSYLSCFILCSDVDRKENFYKIAPKIVIVDFILCILNFVLLPYNNWNLCMIVVIFQRENCFVIFALVH